MQQASFFICQLRERGVMWRPVRKNCLLGRYLGMGVKFAKLSYNISLRDNRLGVAEREKNWQLTELHLSQREQQNHRTIRKLQKEMSEILSLVGVTIHGVWNGQ
jgi:hypothetical protein